VAIAAVALAVVDVGAHLPVRNTVVAA
jgi:hypothetical protein